MVDLSGTYPCWSSVGQSTPASSDPGARASLAPALSSTSMQFPLFVLLTAILFLRPADIIPPLQGLPLYQGVILICIVISFGNILKQITSRSLLAHPISFCMVGLLVAIVLSHLSHMQLDLAAESGDYFFRICLFYFLLVATIDTPERFRRYLVWLLILIGVLTALPLLQHHGVIDLPGLQAIMDRENDLDIGSGQG